VWSVLGRGTWPLHPATARLLQMLGTHWEGDVSTATAYGMGCIQLPRLGALLFSARPIHK
jgi:hypothetical protein